MQTFAQLRDELVGWTERRCSRAPPPDDPGLPGRHLAVPAARVPLHADVLGVRGGGDRRYGAGAGAGSRAAPAALPPVGRQRIRPGAVGRAGRPARITDARANGLMDSGRFLLAVILMIAVMVVTNILLPRSGRLEDAPAADTVAARRPRAPRPPPSPPPAGPPETLPSRAAGAVAAPPRPPRSRRRRRPPAGDTVVVRSPLYEYRSPRAARPRRCPAPASTRAQANGRASRRARPAGSAGPLLLPAADRHARDPAGRPAVHASRRTRLDLAAGTAADARARARRTAATAHHRRLHVRPGPLHRRRAHGRQRRRRPDAHAAHHAAPDARHERGRAAGGRARPRLRRQLRARGHLQRAPGSVRAQRVENGPLYWAAVKNKYFVAAAHAPGVASRFGGLIADPLPATTPPT
jgi:hypothetical protein